MTNTVASVCGPVCFYGETDDTGAFTVTVNTRVQPPLYSVLVHGRPSRTSYYVRLPADAEGDVTVGDVLLLELPPTGPELIVKSDKLGAPAQTLESDGTSLDVAEGVAVKLDVEDIVLQDEGKQFRALRVPPEHHSAFVSQSLGVEMLFAFTPFEAAFVDDAGAPARARLTFSNPVWPAGTAVEFLALGSYLFADWVEPATFEVVATGTVTVTADGNRVEMDPGEGIEYLTWLGVRAKP